MKYIACLIAIILVSGFIGCDDGTLMVTEESNPHAPQFQGQASPNSLSTYLPPAVTLRWSCVDPDGDPLLYKVYLGTTKFPPQVTEGYAKPNYTPRSLKPGTHYYWWVSAEDTSGNVTNSPRWEFITSSKFVYPLAVGNRWRYMGRIYMVDPITDTILSYPQSIHYNSTVEIVSIDTLQDKLETYHFHETIAENNMIYFSDNYFNNTSDGLYNYAYETGGFSRAIPLKKAPGITYEFMGLRYNDPREIFGNFTATPGMPVMATNGDSLIYENPPVKSLEYPLELGNQWTARPINPWRIDKEVIDSLSVRTFGRRYDCYKIKWIYYSDFSNRDDGAGKISGPGPGGIGDTQYDDIDIVSENQDISIIDYVSAIGLVKREILLKNIHITGPMGEDLGTFNSVEKMEITGTELKGE